MRKIYYSIDLATISHPVHWIDEYGEKQIWQLNALVSPSLGDVDKEFLLLHKGACYLKWEQFCKRLEQIAAEKAKLAAWLGGQGL